MEALTLTFSAAVIMGLAFGAGPCNIACLPYLGPVFLSREGGIGSSWRTIVPFSLGRLSGYAFLGAIAGSAGQVVTVWFEERAALVLGVATAVVGLFLFFKARRRGRGCATHHQGEAVVSWHGEANAKRQAVLPLGLFGMGTAMAFNPCVPLGTVLLASAATAQIKSGLILGFGFGIGAVLIPGLIFGILVAHFGEQIRLHLAGWGNAVEQTAAGLLVVLGGMTATGWVVT